MAKRIHSLLVALSLMTAAHPALSQSQPNGNAVTNVRGPLEKMPPSLEVRLALSALPPTLRDNATVYILDLARGYILERAGSMPHVMYHAPGITPADVGGMPCSPCAPYPFVFEPGPHGYVIQRLGDSESAKIVDEEADLVRDLCSYRSALCLPRRDSRHAHASYYGERNHSVSVLKP